MASMKALAKIGSKHSFQPEPKPFPILPLLNWARDKPPTVNDGKHDNRAFFNFVYDPVWAHDAFSYELVLEFWDRSSQIGKLSRLGNQGSNLTGHLLRS
jgi:hypothetical protein